MNSKAIDFVVTVWVDKVKWNNRMLSSYSHHFLLQIWLRAYFCEDFEEDTNWSFSFDGIVEDIFTTVELAWCYSLFLVKCNTQHRAVFRTVSYTDTEYRTEWPRKTVTKWNRQASSFVFCFHDHFCLLQQWLSSKIIGRGRKPWLTDWSFAGFEDYPQCSKSLSGIPKSHRRRLN